MVLFVVDTKVPRLHRTLLSENLGGFLITVPGPAPLGFAEDLFSHGHASSGVVGLYGDGLDLAVLDDDGVPFRPVAAEDGRAVKGKVKSLGELCCGVREEPNLQK